MNILKTLPFVLVASLSFFVLGFISHSLISTYDYIFNLSILLRILIKVGIVAIFIGIFVPLICILVKNPKEKLIILTVILGSLALGYIFNNGTDSIISLTIITILSGLGLFLTNLSIKHLYENQLKPNLGVSVRASIREFFSLFALAIGLAFFVFNNSPERVGEIKEHIVDNVISPISYQIINEADSQITNKIDTSSGILENSLRQFLKQEDGNFSEDQIQNILDEVNVKGVSTQKVLGTFDAKEEINNVIVKQASDIIDPYLKFIVPFAALSLYLSLKTYFSLLKIVIIPLCLLTVSILKKIGFIKEETKTVEVTRLTL